MFGVYWAMYEVNVRELENSNGWLTGTPTACCRGAEYINSFNFNAVLWRSEPFYWWIFHHNSKVKHIEYGSFIYYQVTCQHFLSFAYFKHRFGKYIWSMEKHIMLPLINDLPLHVSGRDGCWLVLVAMVTNAEGSIGQASRMFSGIKQYFSMLLKETL